MPSKNEKEPISGLSEVQGSEIEYEFSGSSAQRSDHHKRQTPMRSHARTHDDRVGVEYVVMQPTQLQPIKQSEASEVSLQSDQVRFETQPEEQDESLQEEINNQQSE